MGNYEESKERPLWNSGDKVITCEMLRPCLGADLGPWEKSLLCEEAERGRAGSGQILLKGDSCGLSQERVLGRKGDSQQSMLERKISRL